jgi:hypothetical protein
MACGFRRHEHDQIAKNKAEFSYQFSYQLASRTRRNVSNFSSVHAVRERAITRLKRKRQFREVAKSGIAPGSGPGDRGFESRLPDHSTQGNIERWAPSHYDRIRVPYPWSLSQAESAGALTLITRIISQSVSTGFSVGSVSRPGRHVQWESVPQEEESGTFVAWVASVEETKRMKPTDKAIFGMVSESPGRNASEPSGGLDKKMNPEAEPSPYGRRQHDKPRADRGGLPLRRGG